MRFIGFLRGINVGGHHKLPMQDLRDKLGELGCVNVKTVLNSGNFAVECLNTDLHELEEKIEVALSTSFGFPVPVILRSREEVLDFMEQNPFAGVGVHQNIRLYVSFLKNIPEIKINIPYISDDKGFKIIAVQDKNIFSVLDLSLGKTTKGMDDLEKLFGKNITTRNWNTIEKIMKV